MNSKIKRKSVTIIGVQNIALSTKLLRIFLEVYESGNFKGWFYFG